MQIFVLIIILLNFLCMHSPEILATQYDKQPARNSSANDRGGRNLEEFDWCVLYCELQKATHIACEHKGQCSKPASPCKFLKIDEEKMVDMHNALRNDFATGKEPRARGIKVADMMALEWDDTLAFLAGCNLVTCPSEMKHDKCHITTNFDTAGQNIAWSKGIDDCVKQSYKFVQNWYDEVTALTETQIRDLAKHYNSSPAGHFTQTIWSKSSHIGCALMSKKTEDGMECMLTCNYAPSGNVLGGRMFTTGSPSSECPAGVAVNAEYDGLCGGEDDDDDYEYYYDDEDSGGVRPSIIREGLFYVYLVLYKVINYF